MSTQKTLPHGVSKNPTFGQWVQNLFLSGMINAVRLLPYKRRVAMMGRFGAGWFGRLAKYHRRALRNVEYVFPDMPEADRHALAMASMDNAGRTIMENYSRGDLRNYARQSVVTGEGVEAIKQARDQGRGIQFVGSHAGNYEAMRYALHDQGFRLGGLYRAMNNPYFNRHYVKTLESVSGPVFPKGREGLMGYRKCLKDGGHMILMIDLTVAGGDEIEFMGHKALTSSAAAAFAIKADALYVPFFVARNDDGISFTIHIGAPIEHTDPVDMTTKATNFLEHHIRKDPKQWLWLLRRWKPFFGS